MNRRTAFAMLVIVNVLGYCVLSFYQTTVAAPPGTVQMPFSNSVEQRAETVDQLKEIKELLKAQNALLRSGDVKVIVTELPKLNAAPAADAQSS